ncbi:unnamed protein product [Rhodiola kirilowii]
MATSKFSVTSSNSRLVLYSSFASDLGGLGNGGKQKKEYKDPVTYEGAESSLGSLALDSDSVASSIKYHAEFTPSFSPEPFSLPKAYFATAESVRDFLIKNWNATYDYYEKINVKQAYYLSMEFLQGRALLNAVGNLELSGAYAEALKKLGHNLEDVASQEPDAALGNGGLGRLASCFLDSLATLNYPAWGYGLRYRYGLFKQIITKDGQEEVAEDWLEMGNPWEIVRNDISYPVKFYGKVTKGSDEKTQWLGEFDLAAFNAGDHPKATQALKEAEKICYVLYPGDESVEGKTLRLKQQYTLCSASLQDIISRYERRSGNVVNWEDFPEKGLSWTEAWSITQRSRVVGRETEATEDTDNFELPPSALELLGIEEETPPSALELLVTEEETPPSALELLVTEEETPATESTKRNQLQRLVKKMKTEVSASVPEPKKKVITFAPDPNQPKLVRMANLSVVSGHAVNGVAAIHTEIVKDEVFNDFYKLWPEKFQNKTNGVTPRRWLQFCNPDLSQIITKWIGTDDWFADNEDLQSEWREAKRQSKVKVAALIKEKTGYVVSPDSMFDVQKKKKEMSAAEQKKNFVPRRRATVNNDPEIGDLLKVVFVPDYNVSVAEVLIPGSELSQHISTAGMEASGTSNMKFAMNGCMLIGTLDGANVEIREEVGEENFFLFGAQAHEIAGPEERKSRGEVYQPVCKFCEQFVPDPRFEDVKAFVKSGVFGSYDYSDLMGSLEGNKGYGQGDYFLVGKDFPDYIECQEKVDEAYRDQKKWTKMSILNTAGSHKFSSDRTIHEYAKDIWNLKPVNLPEP